MKNIVSVVFFVLTFVVSITSFSFPLYIPENDLLKGGSPKFEALNPESISVFVWNIYKGEKKDWYKDFHKIANSADLFATQEFFDSESVEYTYSVRSNDEVLIGLAYGISFWGVTGVATVSKVASNSQKNLRTIAREDFSIKTYKTSLISKYPIADYPHDLLFVNVHLLNSVDVNIYAKEINRVGHQIKNHTGPVVVAGDFNSWSEREAAVNKWAKKWGLNEVRFSPDNRTRFGKSKPIDRIFYKGLEVIDSWSAKVKTSDHNPLGVKLKVLR